MNEYDHEDAFKDANRCAGRLTNISDALKVANTKEQARLILAASQDMYEKLFEAFISGVDWAREEAKKKK